MDREVTTVNKKDVKNREMNSFDVKNVTVSSKHDAQSDSVENQYPRIFSGNCEQFESEENRSSDAEEGNLHRLEDEMPCNEENPLEGETTSLTEAADDAKGLYEDDYEDENENSKNNFDDHEEAVLSNGIAQIFVTRISSGQNERAKTSNEIVLNKETNGKKEEQPKRKLKKKRALAIGDVFFSVAVVAPFVVSYWRGLWTLMELHHEIFPVYGCFFLGMGVHTTFAILKHYFHDKFAKELKAESIFARLGYRLVRMFYTYVFSTACIMHWRGAWIIFDECLIAHEWFLRFVTIACIAILILLRSVRNLIAPPYVVAIDKRGYVFYFPTRFNMNTRDLSLYILDCAFSVAVVGTLVVFVWRGVWVIFDLYLFPDNPEYSAVGSIIIGYTIVVITFSLQPLMRYACTRLKGLPRLVAVDIFLLLSFAGTVNVWRGVWNVLGLWLLPDEPELSCWITHLGCFTFLVLLNCSNSILVRGVYIDAEEAEGKCAVFPCHYLRLFFKIEREKKEARRQNLVVASRDLATITERTEKEENGAFRNSSNSTEDPESLV